MYPQIQDNTNTGAFLPIWSGCEGRNPVKRVAVQYSLGAINTLPYGIG